MEREYELSGIENIARGVCVVDGHVLLCRPAGGGYTYLPGGHIEFGEKGAEALAREVREELGLESKVGDLLGVVESSFVQNGRPHAEISLVYRLDLSDSLGRLPRAPGGGPPPLASREDWIEFVWWPVGRLGEANMLPREMERHVGM
ncbi:MAG: NUDIX domain-containing protein [Kiritimatiellae bacterium]|nr:NUDIX domain-containing protein [Kiritimatiellia bacterium]